MASNGTKAERYLPGEWDHERYWERRKQRVGASEAWDAIGAGDPMGLYFRKIGATPEEMPSLPMRRGLALEPFLEELVQEQTGNKIKARQVVYYRDNLPAVCARVDCEDEQGQLIELKTINWTQAQRLGLGQEGDDIPERWNVQCQVQMLLADVPEMVLGAYVLGSDDFRLFNVVANRKLQAGIYGRCLRFVEYLKRNEPPFDLALDPAQVAHYYKPIEGETFNADAVLEHLIHERKQFTGAISENKNWLDQTNASIRAILKGRTAIFNDGSTMSIATRQRKGYTVEPSEYTQLVYREANHGNGRD
jgi:predicted phage-related endonuclease